MDRKADSGKRRNGLVPVMAAVLCIVSCIVWKNTAAAAWLALESDSVRVGRQTAFIGDTEQYVFKSSNPQTAYVSADGVITGKKPGRVTVTATGGGRKQKFQVTVKANGNKPAIRVCLDEISVGIPEMVMGDGGNAIAFTVENHSENGVAKKVKCNFQCTVLCENIGGAEEPGEEPGKDTISDENGNIDGGDVPDTDIKNQGNNDSGLGVDIGINTEIVKKTVTVDFGKLQPGEEKTIHYFGFAGLKGLEEAELQMLVVYSGGAKMKDDLNTGRISYGWGTKDTTAPVIQGFVGKKSYNGNDVYIVLYEDRKTAYKKYVSAYDNRDGRVEVKADLSGINWKKKGTYDITVTAKDKAGNQARKKMKVQVRCLTGIDLYADRILKRITGDGWSDKAKCNAVYKYVQSHMSYVNYNGGNGWESAALRGLRYGNGNCYAYYSLSRLLLTRAGIPNIMVTRYPAVPNHHHWWNLAYVKGGWYHFDTTPRRLKGRFCLLTDAQLQAYERRSPGTYRYAKSTYPVRAKKVICSGPF